MTFLAYLGAAIAEIAGCFAFWAWLRMDKSAWWLVPGVASLVLFAYLLTLVDAEHAIGLDRMSGSFDSSCGCSGESLHRY